MKYSVLPLLASLALLAACETSSTGAGNADGTGAGASAAGDMTPGSAGDFVANVGDRVFFDYDSAVLSSEAQAVLGRQAEWLGQHTAANVTIEGHCDERGTREYNIALGERRASATKNYLVSLGVDAGRISTISYGKERPAVVGGGEDSWSKNRRGVTVIN